MSRAPVNVHSQFTADDKQLQSAIKRNTDSLNQFGTRATSTLRGVSGDFNGLAKGLRGLHGTGKLAGLTGDAGIVSLLRGAGIGLAIKFAADAVKEGADAWRDYKNGLIGTEEVVLRMIKAIPLLGSIAGATEAIYNAINAERIAEAKKMSAAMEAEFKRREERTKTFGQMRDTAQRINQPDRVSADLVELVRNRRVIDDQLEKIAAREKFERQRAAENEAIFDFGPGRSSMFKDQGPPTAGMSAAQRAAFEAADRENAAAIRKLQAEAFDGISDLGSALRDAFVGMVHKVTSTFKKAADEAAEEARFDAQDAEIDFAERVAKEQADHDRRQADIEDEMEKAARDRKPDKVFRATFEGLNDMFRRIQSGAASGEAGDRGLIAAQNGAAAADRGAKAAEKQVAAVDKIVGLMTQIVQMWPPIAAVG